MGWLNAGGQSGIMVCKNCGNVFEGNYCNNCGQPADTHAIDTHFVMHDLSHGILHVHGGLFYSARELFSRPGHAIRDYIQGKRIKHYKPISMLVVLATFYGLFYHALDINILAGKQDGEFDYTGMNEWIGHHFSIITVALLPFLSLSSYLVFRKYGYSYMEHIIINAFYSAQKIWLRILSLPILFMAKDTSNALLIMQWLMLPDLLLMFWSYGQVFRNVPRFKVFLLVIATTLLSLLFTAVITGLYIVLFWN